MSVKVEHGKIVAVHIHQGRGPDKGKRNVSFYSKQKPCDERVPPCDIVSIDVRDSEYYMGLNKKELRAVHEFFTQLLEEHDA